MVASKNHKSPDKSEVCRKILVLLKRHYSHTHPRAELPVLETMLYACCLEDASPESADQAYARLLNSFHDLNEARVSSIPELAMVFQGMSDPEWRAIRVKHTLQFVFESTYSFDFDSLKRKTNELAVKQLAKIKTLSSFVRSYTMQHSLQSHVLPLDSSAQSALIWLGLVEPAMDGDAMSDALRPFVRKADAPLFCHLLRCLVRDPKYVEFFDLERHREDAARAAHADGPDSGPQGYERLETLFRQGVAAFRRKETPRRAVVPAAKGVREKEKDTEKDKGKDKDKSKVAARPRATIATENRAKVRKGQAAKEKPVKPATKKSAAKGSAKTSPKKSK